LLDSLLQESFQRITQRIMERKTTFTIFSSINLVALAVWFGRVDVIDFFNLVTTKIPEGTPEPSLSCMMTQCGAETFACLTDKMCLKALACVAPCGSDQACTFSCISNYETPLFHQLNKCNIHDAGCIVLAEPEEKSTCGGEDDDSTAVPELSLEDLHGQWFIIEGQNEIYDCFPCQIFTFANDTEGTHMVYMDYQVDRIFGDTVNKTVIETITQPDPTKEGLLELSGIQNGLFHSERWRILAFSKDSHIIAAYCGTMTSWVYHGLVVLTKIPQPNQEVQDKISLDLNDLGVTRNTLCKPKIVGCTIENLRVSTS